MIIGLSGYARSGKDTVAERLATAHGFTVVRFADALKEAVYVLNPIVNGKRYADVVDEMGLDAAKAAFPEVRRLQQAMGTDVARELWGEDFWVDRLADKIYTFPHHPRYVIPDVRFPNEAKFVASEAGQLWRIHRPGIGPVNDHPSETALDDWVFDRHITNDKTVAALHETADYLVEALL